MGNEMMRRAVLLLIVFAGALASATQAPQVTSPNVIHHDGQSFANWCDPTSGTPGNYRYDLRMSTSGAVTALNMGTLVQTGIFNNSGQLFPYNNGGTRPNFDQSTRTNTSLRMAIIQSGGSPLSCGGSPTPNAVGLAVHTAKVSQTVWFGVVTHDRTGALTDSDPVDFGSIAETVAPIKPILQIAASVRGFGVVDSLLSFYLQLHASGGTEQTIGDLWCLWGDDSQGYQDGIPWIFAISETSDPTGTITHVLKVTPSDKMWSSDGTTFIETFWYGYELGSQVYPYTQARLAWLIAWVPTQYSVDPNKYFSWGQSMGGGGTGTDLIRQGDVFQINMATVPVWSWQNKIYKMFSPFDEDASAGALPVNGKSVTYGTDSNTPVEIGLDCTKKVDPNIWSFGLTDTFSPYPINQTMIASLKACHYFYAVLISTGDHGSTPAVQNDAKLKLYGNKFAKGQSYPVPTNFSLDGDPVSCSSTCYINAGWSWSGVSETSTTWAATISNSEISSSATVDLTPGNPQTFALVPGQSVNFSIDGGSTTTFTADEWGKVAATGVTISGTGNHTIAFTALPAPTPNAVSGVSGSGWSIQ